ncbi:odorant-binding protein 59a isoform X2 [Nomia melanderi]|uniref:odorant-binding protein 59a isoform X2 n=1 Tax=Nomia melanderi TaxID=2448451 RepID=UPI0013042443|nr:general odorant-binding protein 71 isoform X2 [Nomia melanderi]
MSTSIIITWIIIASVITTDKCLKCRTGSQQMDMQYQKVFKTCLKRHAAVSTENDDSTSSDSDSSDSNNSDRDFQIATGNRKNDSQDFWNFNDSQMKKDDHNGDDPRHGNNTDRDKACVIQCFFDEMNAVDEKGFPERDLVIPLMNQDVRDPELKDFIEESVIECFRYLESIKKDKCEFSQNLLKCFAEKGQQQCEDWEN